MREIHEQPSISSSKIVLVEQPINLTGYSIRLDQVATSSGQKRLELFYYRPKLSFDISIGFLLPVPQVKGPRPHKRDNKRKKKTAVIRTSLCKNELEEK